MDLMTTLSLVVGIVSIVLAIVAMITAKSSEKNSQDNFEKTQKMMHEIYDKTKDALAQIDKKSEIIEHVVQRNEEQLLNTMTNLISEVLIHKRPEEDDKHKII
jgi:Fe2+ transport system protein B